MKEQLNLVEILKDCPKGMELDCTMYDNVTLKSVSDDPDNTYPICIEMKCDFIARLTKYGQNACINDAKCVIFPKGKTTWEGFQRPFVDGDVVYAKVYDLSYIIIYHKQIDERVYRHACLCLETDMFCCDKDNIFTDDPIDEWRLATEEEKAKLFQVIKDKGYKWDPETKTLEKIIVPKFKVGDRIISIENEGRLYTINGVYNSVYGLEELDLGLPINEQDNWELVLNKFDPKTLQPFDKVLVRYIGCDTYWQIQFFETMYECNKNYPIRCLGSKLYSFCIPYNDDTKHLVNKMDEAPEFYRYWEN